MTTVYQAHEPNAAFHTAQRVKVSVGGKAISKSSIAHEMQNHEASTPLEAWQAASRALVVRELLLQEARRLDLVASPQDDGEGRRETEEEALIRSVTVTQVVSPEVDDETCQRYYDRNLQRFHSADLHEVSHILLPALPGEPAARAAAKERAAGLIALLREAPGTFEALAAQHSACPSALAGGSLGQIKRGDTVPEFETALAKLQPGEIADAPVESRYGFHIIRAHRKIEGRVLPFEIVKERIATYLTERSTRIATAHYLAVLASCTEIIGIDMPTPADLGAMH